MSFSHGRGYLAIPGPSVTPDAVLRAMHTTAPNIYEGDLIDLTHSLIPDLKTIAGTQGEAAIYIANGHGAWEAAVSNILAPGDTVLVLATGRFCIGWGEMAAACGVTVETIDFGKRGSFDLDQVRAALRADTTGRITAVMAVHTDTSSGVCNDIAALRAAIDDTGHDALFLVDCICSLGCDEFRMDDWGVDVMVSACQKGLMTPPGLGFVFFNDKAKAKRATMDRVSSYWDWIPRVDPQVYYQYFCGTAPTHHLLGLRAALDMMLQEGMPNVWSRHRMLARAIWAACDAWGADGPLELNMADPARRSCAVTALRIGAPDGTRLREWVAANTGVTLGIGLGMAEPDDPAWHGFFRIGHMGHVNAHMVLGVLAAIEAGLTALEIPRGAGGVAAAAKVIADAADGVTVSNARECC